MFLEQQISGLFYRYELEGRFQTRFQLQKTWKCSGRNTTYKRRRGECHSQRPNRAQCSCRNTEPGDVVLGFRSEVGFTPAQLKIRR